MAKAVSPYIANEIGTYFKVNEIVNSIDGGNRAEQGSAAHLLAHTILGAAVSYAIGNDALTGGVSAAAGEAAAPLLMKYLYDTKDPSELTAEQKDTISSITSLTGTVIGATTGNVTDAVNAGETAKVAVENNLLKQRNLDSLVLEISRLRRVGKEDEAKRKIWSITGEISNLANQNWKEIEACYANPTDACFNKIRSDYSNVNFDTLKGLVHENANAVNSLTAIERRNSIIVNCNSDPVICLENAHRMGVANGMATANLIGGSVATSMGVQVASQAGKGNVFRGRSKSSRDNWYGYNDKSFQRWWHREGKKDFGGQDINNTLEAEVAYDTWIQLGKPNVK